MIKIKNFSCSYNSHKNLINNLNVEINDGEALIICGKSGAGKSTLLNIISGISPNLIKVNMSGIIEILNNRASTFVFQNPHIYSFANIALEELSFELENLGIAPDEIVKKINEISIILDLKKILLKNLVDLSAGQKMKVSIASALITTPDILLFDEPLPALDKECQLKFIDILNQLKKNGKTLIIAEHLIAPLLPIADKILFFNDNYDYKIFNAPFNNDDYEYLFNAGIRSKKINYAVFNNGKIQNEAIIKLNNVSFGYEKNKIFENLNFDFFKGELMGIIGNNGSGKTTFLKLLAEILKIDQGMIEIIGKSAYIDQNPDRLLFEKSVFDEISVGSRLDKESIENIMKKLDILKLASRNPLHLSIGEKHRVAVASALAQEPDIILLDEPASGLDFYHLKDMFDELKKMVREQQKTIITASNDLELLELYCDRIINIEDLKKSKKGEKLKNATA
ncbi:MAG TPA: ATP-binding cassette domain-containing protein [bacterium]|mgnify:CR=1 FL=1|nr:ATP-binding cassette domain-containing protein [bacterium]